MIDPAEEPRVSLARATIVPRVGVVESIRRNWLIAVIPVVLLVAAAVYLGLERRPTYKATTTISVGRLNVAAPGAVAGFTQATQTLAASYSRAINAQGVTRSVAQRLRMKPEDVAARVSATPIPQSPVIRLAATGPSRSGTVRLVNEAREALIRYVVVLNRSNPDADRLFRDFGGASLELNQLRSKVDAARANYRRSKSSGDLDRLNKAQSAVDSAGLRAESIRRAYAQTQQTQSSTAMLQTLTAATGATSDRRSVLQLLLLAAVIAGLLAGAALATLRANSSVRKALRMP